MRLLQTISMTGALLLSTITFAQNYKSAIGLRGGNAGGYYNQTGGINYKTFIGGSNALEFTVGGGRDHLRLQGMYEWHNDIGEVNGLDWYLGIGAAAGFWDRSFYHPVHDDFYYNEGLFLGGVGAVGLDYTIPDIPINFALDVGPYLGVINSYRFGWGGGLAIRYVLN